MVKQFNLTNQHAINRGQKPTIYKDKQLNNICLVSSYGEEICKQEIKLEDNSLYKSQRMQVSSI